MVNPYTVLEVEPTAAQDDVKRSYRALALRYHPDKAGPDGAEKFKEVQAAYEILSDPVKRQRYDQFGDAGDMIPEMVVVSRTVRCVSALVVWVSLALIVLFTAFLAVYCDGKLKSWNMVKVFSPLFILDFFMLVLSLPVLAAFWRGGVLVLLCVSCVIALTIIVPVGKDTNDSRTQNYLQWRVLLIPGYIFSVFTTIIGIIISFKDSCCWIRFIQQFAFPLFFALVACRADESITSSYFVVIGLPVYLFFGIMLFLSLWPLSCARCWMVFTQGAPAIAIIISASLVAKRLDYFHSHGTYDGIFTLSKALIPIFIVEGLMLLGLTIVLIPFCLVPNVTVSDPPESKVDSDEDPPPCEAEPTKESTKSPQEPKKELPQGDRASDID